mmetsp:Transcript_37932/g.107173  ORF Transcript_37932/g.107173 Transcript_37932/m.107173 type:complete len:490 (-) Transcript_37932:79-1548(-)
MLGFDLARHLAGGGKAASQEEAANTLAERLWKELKPLQALARFVLRVARKDVPRHKFLILGFGALFTLGSVRRRAQTALEEKIEAVREEAAHRKRMKSTRRTHAGPLLRASADLSRYLKLVLAPPGIDFVRENFPDKPEMTLVSSMYIFTRFVYYRWLLYDQLKFEHVSPEDSWQWVMEHLLWGLALAAGSKEIGMEEYVRQCHREPLPEGKDLRLELAKPLDCPVLRNAVRLSSRREYPLRMMPYERDAIAELMERQRPAGDGPAAAGGGGGDVGRGHCECHRYVEFAAHLKAALAAADEGREHPWAPYFLPLWKDLIRFTALQMQPYGGMELQHVLELVQFRVRLRALQHSVGQLTQVLSLPLEAWNHGRRLWRRAALPCEFLSGLRPSMRRRLRRLDASAEDWLAFLRLGLRVATLWEVIRTVTWARAFPALCQEDHPSVGGEAGPLPGCSQLSMTAHGAKAIRNYVLQMLESDGSLAPWEASLAT